MSSCLTSFHLELPRMWRRTPSGGDGDGSRVYGPRNFDDESHVYQKQDETQALVAKIEKLYSHANLDGDEATVDGSGYCCLGLLDPIANIRVNGFIHDDAATAAPPTAGKGSSESVARRSLDGLIAFLTCLFPYLPDVEAFWYLAAAELDPLVAALLIIDRRGIKKFGFCSATTVAAVEVALGGAAAAAQHPDPRRLVLGWKSLSPRLKELAAELSHLRPHPSATGIHAARGLIATATATSPADLELEGAWELARCRLAQRKQPIGRELPPARAAMKRMLLAAIHRSYLTALGSLPQRELTERLHRSMLHGGSSYGPLDPVSNIIVNTVWHDQNFPASKKVKLDMISTKCLWRAAARSLYGLVSFLCTRYQNLTPDHALQRLMVTGADLRDADPNLFMSEEDCRNLYWCEALQIGLVHKKGAPSVTVQEAYAAAAAAAHHPDPVAQTEFLGSPDTVANLKVASKLLRLQDGRLLSSKDLEFLSMLISSKCPSAADMSHEQPEPEPTKVNIVFYSHVTECRRMFRGQQERAREMVAAALSKFNETAEPHYRLHVICGVNELVSGPEFSLEISGGYNPWTPHIYLHSHINFLATREGEHPTLFFAECENHDTGTWCVPVSQPQRNDDPDAGVNPDAATDPYAEQVRCIYCEYNENMIVHPAVSGFHGRDNFVDLFYGSDRYSNDKAVLRALVDWVDELEDDNVHINVVPADEVDPGDLFLLNHNIS